MPTKPSFGNVIFLAYSFLFKRNFSYLFLFPTLYKKLVSLGLIIIKNLEQTDAIIYTQYTFKVFFSDKKLLPSPVSLSKCGNPYVKFQQSKQSS